MGNTFNSKGGGQNVGQGDHAIGKQVNVTQSVSGDGCIFSGTGNVTVNKYGVPHEVFAQYVKELGATEQVVEGFFGTLLKEKVPRDQWDSKLREIAATHKELLARLDSVQDEDPQVAKLKTAAKQAMDAGDYVKAESLLEDIANRYSIAAAEAHADNARQEVQLRYAKAAAYWQKAAALLPEDEKKDRSLYLHSAAFDLYRIAEYKKALPLLEQSLTISREIGDKKGEGDALNGISQIYDARGDYGTAMKYLKQSLVIRQEIGDKVGEGATLNNISLIYSAGRGDYATALKYLEQSLHIQQEIGDRVGEGVTLNNIGQIYHAQGDYGPDLRYFEQSLVIHREVGNRAMEGTTLNNISQIYSARGDYGTALKYLEQSLTISREIGDRAGEAVTSWNIGVLYEEHDYLRKAELYISRAGQLAEEIGDPSQEKCRKHLEAVRAKLKGL